jgi:toxin ParE1/3/4
LTIQWSRTASSHLLELDDYLAEKSPKSAAVIVDRIYRMVDTLERFPLAGRPGRVPATREMVIPGTKYIVVYQLDDETINILAVLHGAQRWPRRFR